MLQVDFLLKCFPALKPAQVIVRDSSQYPAQLQSALQAVNRDGFDIVLDAVAGEFFRPSYEAMARGGRHVVFGAANWTPTGEICSSILHPQLSTTTMSGCGSGLALRTTINHT